MKAFPFRLSMQKRFMGFCEEFEVYISVYAFLCDAIGLLNLNMLCTIQFINGENYVMYSVHGAASNLRRMHYM